MKLSETEVDRIVAHAITGAKHQSLENLILILLSSTACWVILWITVHVLKKGSNPGLKSYDERVQWNSRVVSLIHAIASSYGGWRWFVGCGLLQTNPVEATFHQSQETEMWLMITAGYLLYDLALLIYYARILGSLSMYLHHIIVLSAFFAGAALRIGTLYMAAFLVNEVSTIFLNFNYFLAMTPKLRNSIWYKVNGVAFLITFTIFRTIQNSAVTYHIFARAWKYLWIVVRALPTKLQLGCAGLTILAVAHTILNIAWLGEVVKASSRKLARSSSGSDDESEDDGQIETQNESPQQRSTRKNAFMGPGGQVDYSAMSIPPAMEARVRQYLQETTQGHPKAGRVQTESVVNDDKTGNGKSLVKPKAA